MNSTGAQRTGNVIGKEDLSPELLEKYEAWQNRSSKSNPLYETEGHRYGVVPRGEEVEFKSPKYAKAGNFSKHFLPRKGESKTTLDTAIVSAML